MATKQRNVSRKGATVTAGAKAASAKTTKAQAAPAEEEDEEAKAAAKAEADAAEAARQESLQDLKGRLSDTLTDLTQADAASAIEVREKWVAVGDLVKEGRALFMSEGSNNVNTKAFGKWLVEQGFTAIGARPSRAAVIWLSDVYHTKPDLYNLFPTESYDGEPLRRSPRTLQSWVRDNVCAAFQDAWEADADNIAIASEAEKDKREDVAKKAMPNVYSALNEALEIAQENADKAEKKMKSAKNAADRKAAMSDYEAKASVLDGIQLRKSIMDQHTDEERLAFFVGWKPKVPTVSFKDAETDEAAARLFALLKTHEEFVAVYEALGGMVDELVAKVDADAGEPDEGDEEPEEDVADDADIAEDDGADVGGVDADFDEDDGDFDFDADDEDE